jgi:hypothetical protein
VLGADESLATRSPEHLLPEAAAAAVAVAGMSQPLVHSLLSAGRSNCCHRFQKYENSSTNIDNLRALESPSQAAG